MRRTLAVGILLGTLAGVQARAGELAPGPLADETSELTPGELKQQKVDRLRLDLDAARDRRQKLHMPLVGPLVVIGIGALAIGSAVLGNVVEPTCTSCEGVPGWLALGTLGGLVLSIGVVVLGIDALVYFIRRGNLDGELRELEQQVAALESSLGGANPSRLGVVVARF